MLRRSAASLLPRLLQQQGGTGAAPLAAACQHQLPSFGAGDDKPGAAAFRGKLERLDRADTARIMQGPRPQRSLGGIAAWPATLRARLHLRA